MKKLSFSTLALKLKRHNLHFEYNETSNLIEIGKPKNLKRKMLQGVLLGLGSVFIMIVIAVTIDNNLLRKIVIYAIFAPIAYGISEIFKYMEFANLNKYRKFITPKSFRTESEKGDITILKESINKIEIHTLDGEELSGAGVIMFNLTNGEKLHALTLHGKKKYELKKDLEYIKDFLVEFMEIKQ